ncbi:hypothetical protein BJ912DRAFT_1070632 [Pholiota molesta]|nr:hypothetical protein BJ912DRAFT_1070632 [Pholiota molesta]
MDANFRLKNQLVSNYSQDPGLGIGWAYMVPRKPYEAYVLSKASEEDYLCWLPGAFEIEYEVLSWTEVYRHQHHSLWASEMVLPLGVGNLQKGERYPNMDYIFGSTLQFVAIHLVLISYDIMCQWFINLSKRINEDWPEHIKPRHNVTFIPAIPKLHEPMHKAVGHEVFSLNFIKGSGHSDCECVERVWASHNALANSTKTQGPGSRQDVLDDHFGFWNWEKYTAMGLRSCEGTRLPSASDLVTSWEKICTEWDEDKFPKTKKNPYQLDTAGRTSLRGGKFLGERWHLLTRYYGVGVHLHGFGFGRDPAPYSSPGERNALISRIRAWEQLLPIYVPGLLQYHSDYPPSERRSSNPEDAAIWLPSRLPEPHRSRICVTGLPAIEERIRDAQLPDSLENVKRILKIKSRMIAFKNKNIRGQRDGTRSRAVIDRVHDRARYSAEKYREARTAKYALTGPGEWETKYRVLEDGDVRGYQDPNRLRQRVGRRGVLEDDQLEGPTGVLLEDSEEFTLFDETRRRRDGTGETRRTLSWIWLTTPSSASDDDKDDEPGKGHSRREEVMILKEEMRRVLAYLEWKATWWRAREHGRDGITKDLMEGLASYSRSQARLQESLAAHFRRLWASPLQEDIPPADLEGNSADSNVIIDEDEDDYDEGDADFHAGYDDGETALIETPVMAP